MYIHFYVIFLTLCVVNGYTSNNLNLQVNDDTGTVVMRNNYVKMIIEPGIITSLSGDFDGNGHYGNNVLHYMALERDNSPGKNYSSSSLTAKDIMINVLRNDSDVISVKISGIVDDSSDPTVIEDWLFTLERYSRDVIYNCNGKTNL